MKEHSMTLKMLGGIASSLQAMIFFITPVVYFIIVPAATGLTGSDFSDPFKLRSVLADNVFESVFRSLSMVVPGLTSSGRRFLGWTLILLGMSGWTTNKLPRHCVSLFNGISGRVFSFGVMLPLPHQSHELLLESHSYLKVKQIRY